MQLHRLIVDDPGWSLTLDLHPRLTVVFQPGAVGRAQLVDTLVGMLGPSRDGVHVELTLGTGQPLVLFRPPGDQHRVIDTRQTVDLTDAFRSAGGGNGRVDLLGRLGLPASEAHEALLVRADEVAAAVARSSSTGAGSPLVRHLAGLDQRMLWEAAEQLVVAEDRLDAVVGHGPIGEPADRDSALDRTRRLHLAHELHDRVETAARSHRGVLRLGGIVAGVCAGLALLLLAVDNLLEDDGWTSKALLMLAVLAGAVALWDGRAVAALRREEQELLASLGVTRFETLRSAAGPLADDETTRRLLTAAADYEPVAERWRVVSGGAPLEEALGHRAEVERLARREVAVATGEVEPVGLVAWLGKRAGSVAAVGPQRERLPLVLDDPFTGLDPADASAALDAVDRLPEQHQIVLVTGDAGVLSWALSRAEAGDLALTRLDPVPQSLPA